MNRQHQGGDLHCSTGAAPKLNPKEQIKMLWVVEEQQEIDSEVQKRCLGEDGIGWGRLGRRWDQWSRPPPYP